MRARQEANVTDPVWISALTLCVLGYLLYALLMPEKF
jgi:K+-transporting ATPase KdpF subunit